MPLFHIQDRDRPAWIVAKNYGEALEQWGILIERENDGDRGEPPDGIQHVCPDTELIVDGDWIDDGINR